MNSTAIGIFRAGITPIERMLKTTVGRESMLGDLLSKLRQSVDKKGIQHFVFIGPRGIGKTHFLTLLEHNVQNDPALNARYTVVRFPEENVRILSFADLLLEIAYLLGDAVDDESLRSVYEKQSVIDDDQAVIDSVIPHLRSYRKKAGKLPLLLIENLDTLLTQQIKNQQDIHRLRTFLMDTPCVMLIGTSPVYFPGLYDVKSPLYDFFDVQVLDDLSEAQTIDLLRRNLEWENRGDILKDFDILIPRIKAIHDMTGGNPRLIMMLYELIAHDNILDVKVQFQKLLDQISPFYQDRLKELAPQERALLETIALMRREPKTPSNISLRLRKTQRLVSSLLQRMVQAGYLVAFDNPGDKRSRLYRIKEGFFDLWLSMNESRVYRKRLPYIVDFLNNYYSKKIERERKRKELSDLCEKGREGGRQYENSMEMLDHLSEVGGVAEKCGAKTDLAVRHLKQGDTYGALDYFREIRSLSPEKPVLEWMRMSMDREPADDKSDEPLQWLDGLIDEWKQHRTGDFEKVTELAEEKALEMSGYGLQKVRIELMKDLLEHEENTVSKIQLLLKISSRLKMIGSFDEALQYLERNLLLCQETGEKSGEGATLNNISQIYDSRGDYSTTLTYLERSLVIFQEIGNKSGEGNALNNIGQIYDSRGDYSTALTYLERSLAIFQEIGDKSGEGTTLNNISRIYYCRGDYSTALTYFNRSLVIFQETGCKSGVGTTLNNIGLIYKARNEYSTALTYLDRSLAIFQEIGDKSGEGTTLNNISQIYYSCGDYSTAFQFLKRSLAISQEIGDKSGEGTTLNNIGQIYDSRGDYSTALTYLERSLAIFKEIGDKPGEGSTLNNISQIYYARGDYATALTYLERSLAIRQEIGDKAGMISTLYNMSQIAFNNKELQQFADYITRAYSLSEETGNAEGRFHIGKTYGLHLCRSGRSDRGLPILRKSLEVGKKAGFPGIDEVEQLITKYESAESAGTNKKKK